MRKQNVNTKDRSRIYHEPESLNLQLATVVSFETPQTYLLPAILFAKKDMKCVCDDFRLTVMFPHHHRHVEHYDAKDSDLECFTCYHVVNFTEYLVL